MHSYGNWYYRSKDNTLLVTNFGIESQNGIDSVFIAFKCYWKNNIRFNRYKPLIILILFCHSLQRLTFISISFIVWEWKLKVIHKLNVLSITINVYVKWKCKLNNRCGVCHYNSSDSWKPYSFVTSVSEIWFKLIILFLNNFY